MARDLDDKRQDLAFIDYKSLGVRQLGSIYEGLLEFKLRIAPEKMAVVKGKKTEEVIPYREAQKEDRKILTKGRGKMRRKESTPKGGSTWRMIVGRGRQPALITLPIISLNISWKMP